MISEGIRIFPPTQITEATCFPYRTAKLTGTIRQIPRDSPDGRAFESTLRTRAGQVHPRNHSVYVIETISDGPHYYMVTDHLIKEGEKYIEEAW